MSNSLQEFVPQEPKSCAELELDPDLLSNLTLKHIYIHGKQTPRKLAKTLKINADIAQQTINELKKQELVAMSGGSGLGGDYFFDLYPKGIERARNIMQRDQYCGPAPVSVEQYKSTTQKVLNHNKTKFSINRELMEEKFSHHLGYKDILFKIGQVVCARKPAFVYGFPGNGKTYLCNSVVNLLPPIIVPYAVEISNQIVRVFDPSCHVPVENFDYYDLDQRWIAIKPPLIVAGGELTLDDLDVKFNEKFSCFDTPPQVKATGGVLLIDDLGRQKSSVTEIFNRMIIPLENKVDYLVLGGQRMQVPTDAIVLFSTNLDPSKIVDDAFLRRLPYKINVRNPSIEEYTQIWKSFCEKLNLNFNQQSIDKITSLYKNDKRGLRAVHPRDILTLISDRKKYLEEDNSEITDEEIEDAYNTYFVSDLTLVEKIE